MLDLAQDDGANDDDSDLPIQLAEELKKQKELYDEIMAKTKRLQELQTVSWSSCLLKGGTPPPFHLLNSFDVVNRLFRMLLSSYELFPSPLFLLLRGAQYTRTCTVNYIQFYCNTVYS